HVFTDGPGDDNAVGMPGGGDELNSEAPQVEDDRSEHVEIGLASVAAGGTHLAELERTPEESARFFVERSGPLERLAMQNQIVATPRRHPVIECILDRPFRAGTRAVGTEQAPPQIERKIGPLRRDRPSRTGLRTLATALRAFRRVNDRQP